MTTPIAIDWKQEKKAYKNTVNTFLCGMYAIYYYFNLTRITFERYQTQIIL